MPYSYKKSMVIGGLFGGLAGSGISFGFLGAHLPRMQDNFFKDYVNQQIADNPVYHDCVLNPDMTIQCFNWDDRSQALAHNANSFAEARATEMFFLYFFSGYFGLTALGAMSGYVFACLKNRPFIAAVNTTQKPDNWHNNSRLQEIGFDGEVPENFIDPIFFMIMDEPEKTAALDREDPRVIRRQDTYDSKSFRALLGICPTTKLRLVSKGIDTKLQFEIKSFMAEREKEFKTKNAQSTNEVAIKVGKSDEPNPSLQSSPGFLYTSNSRSGSFDEKNSLEQPLLSPTSSIG